MTSRVLHFTLGPVQGFIADARRVRDFWAGSFLLSWLSGKAMVAVTQAGGEIVFPEINGDELFEAIKLAQTGDKASQSPYIGSLPNRFKAQVPKDFDVKGVCVTAIEKAWEELTEKIWIHFIANNVANLGNGGAEKTREIWDRQIKGFWEMSWVIGDDPGDGTDSTWLDQRKNWRTHMQADEPGDLCRLMGRYQELSGYHRIGGKDKQREFWDTLAEQKYSHPSGGERSLSGLNLKHDERLCSIALIKRLFPLVAKEVLGWQPGGNDLSVINWPSVSYLAAVPWLKALNYASYADACETYFDTVKQQIGSNFKGETETRLFGFSDEDFFKLDGHLIHKDGIAAWQESSGGQNIAAEKQVTLQKALNTLQGKLGGIVASEFYGVLIMDGDGIGQKIGNQGHAKIVKAGLADFTNRVKRYFDPGNSTPASGMLVYAGGDDVLAFTPVDSAIEAARHLRSEYMRAFEQVIKEQNETEISASSFTLSGAIIFAQYKIPLNAVLKQAHHYIDNIAKEKNGRDSLALAVMKPGGIAYDWVSCWGENPVLTMEQVAVKSASKASDFSSSFFYNIRERYAPLFYDDTPHEDREVPEAFGDASLMEAVLAAEYKKQPGCSQISVKEAKEAIQPLLTISRPLKREGEKVTADGRYLFDAALVARFLSVEGRWNLTEGGINE